MHKHKCPFLAHLVTLKALSEHNINQLFFRILKWPSTVEPCLPDHLWERHQAVALAGWSG